MFSFGEKNTPLKAEKLCDVGVQSDGLNRRATGLMPMPTSKENHEILLAGSIRYTNLLLSIESRQTSCCLRVVSPSKKSRCAILIYHGRVMGCIYGRKGLEQQLFGKEAYHQAVNDLLQPSTLIDAYPLSEELVLAAGALFQGNLSVVPSTLPAEQLYLKTVSVMLERGAVGCVVINNPDGMAKCVTYVFAGKIVGLYSFAKGWLVPIIESGAGHVKCSPYDEIMVSTLSAANAQDVLNNTFSLTGLSDHDNRTTMQIISEPEKASL
jgi:hypothetical protein